MTDQSNDPGFKVTLKDVYTDVQELKELVATRLPEDVQTRLRKVESQIAAQWVVVGIVIAAIGGLVAKAFLS
jgi:TRAP-type mannitol/chloroaromatic compound transport system permease large subunit